MKTPGSVPYSRQRVEIRKLDWTYLHFQQKKDFVSWLRLSPWLLHHYTAPKAYYRKISRRRGAREAAFATSRKLATLVFRMLKYGQDCTDIGEQAYEARFQERLSGLKSFAKSTGYEFIQTKEAV